MKYTHATLLLNETGAEINETNLTAVLEAAGDDVNTSRVKAVVASLEDVDLSEYAAADHVDDGEAVTMDDEVTAADERETETDTSETSAADDLSDIEAVSTTPDDSEEDG